MFNWLRKKLQKSDSCSVKISIELEDGRLLMMRI